MTTPNDLTSRVEQRVRESMAVKEALLRDKKLVGLIAEVGRDWAEALRGGHRTFLFGNGGSAADAQHIAAELVSRYLRDRPGLPVVALTVNTSSLTAIANDYSYDAVFARQLEALGRAGDMAIGISTSGNSRNVLLAIETAKRKGMTSLGLTGQGGGQLRGLVDRCICVPSGETPRVQESHILIGHILCEIVERELFGGSGTQAPLAAQSEPGCGSGPSHDGQAREGRNPAKTGP
jgi:D-sedoheptulose 7-phosphate isomerase